MSRHSRLTRPCSARTARQKTQNRTRYRSQPRAKRLERIDVISLVCAGLRELWGPCLLRIRRRLNRIFIFVRFVFHRWTFAKPTSSPTPRGFISCARARLRAFRSSFPSVCFISSGWRPCRHLESLFRRGRLSWELGIAFAAAVVIVQASHPAYVSCALQSSGLLSGSSFRASRSHFLQFARLAWEKLGRADVPVKDEMRWPLTLQKQCSRPFNVFLLWQDGKQQKHMTHCQLIPQPSLIFL